MRKFLFDEEGQAIVEYILMLSVVVVVIGVMASSFRGVLRNLWLRMAKDISAPCPGCLPDPQVRFR